MVVLLTGMFRSGSTWAFNVARVLLLANSPPVFGEFRDDISTALAARDGAVGHHLIKTHRPDAVGRALICDGTCRTICTYRNVLECIASHMETFRMPFDEALTLGVEALDFLRFQAAIDDVLFIAYEDIVQRPTDAVGVIGRHLDMAIDANDAAVVADGFSRENVARYTMQLRGHGMNQVGRADVWDSVTLFSSRHIRANPSPPEALLSPAQLRQALDRLGESVDARGVLTGALARRLARAHASRG